MKRWNSAALAVMALLAAGQARDVGGLDGGFDLVAARRALGVGGVEQILRERGWEENSFQAQQFARKLIGGEMVGFNTSPNSYAAIIVMLVFMLLMNGLAIYLRNKFERRW